MSRKAKPSTRLNLANWEGALHRSDLPPAERKKGLRAFALRRELGLTLRSLHSLRFSQASGRTIRRYRQE